MTINIPTPSLSLIGCRLNFRRVGAIITPYIAINITPNIYPNTALTTTNVLLSATQYAVSIYCCYITATTYGWFVI
jgi:hypothetical protein